jgi:hypothetical protein
MQKCRSICSSGEFVGDKRERGTESAYVCCDRSIRGFLGEKICVLVTHQIQFLEDATKIVVLENVSMVEMTMENGWFVNVCVGCNGAMWKLC